MGFIITISIPGRSRYNGEGLVYFWCCVALVG
jgi:hypothetical protein